MLSQIKLPKIVQKTLWYLPVALLIAAYSFSPLQGFSDFFDQAAVGRWIVAAGHVPHHTLFLWSARQPWIAHSWLSELFMYRLMRFHGDTVGEHLAILWTVLMLWITFGLLFFVAARRAAQPWPLIVAFGLAVYACSPRFLARAELFSDLATVTLLLLLIQWDRDAKAQTRPRVLRLLTALILLFILWTNLHGGVLYGLVLLGLQGLGNALQDRWTLRTRQLLLLFLACILAVAVNPYGFRYYTIFQPVHSRVFAHIKEWQPPFPTPISEMPYLGAIVCVFTVAVLVWAQSQGRRVSQLLWLLFCAAAFLIARRNIITLDLVCLVVISVNGDVGSRRLLAGSPSPGKTPSAQSPLSRWGSLFGAMLAVGLYLNALAISPIAALPWPPPAVTPFSVPMQQLAFLKRSDIKGRVLNPYDTASYYEWELYGHNTFFIDSINAYPDSLIDMQKHVLLADGVGKDYLEHNGINCIIESHMDRLHATLPLWQELPTDRDWSNVYQGFDGSIWVRRVSHSRSNLGKQDDQ